MSFLLKESTKKILEAVATAALIATFNRVLDHILHPVAPSKRNEDKKTDKS